MTPTGNLKKLVMNCILRSKCYVAVFSVILDFTILTSKWQVYDTFVLKSEVRSMFKRFFFFPSP